MQLLVALHQADGSVVGKDDLALLCWEGRIVGEDAINRVVSRLRAVAEKQAGGQFRIETITKVGYRLIVADGLATVQHAHSLEAPSPQPVVSRRNLVIGGSTAAIVAAGGSAAWILSSRDTMPAEARMLVDEARKSLREGSIDSPDNAVGTLRHATQIAPASAEPWGLLAYAYMVQASAADSHQGPGLRARAVDAMNRAFSLEQNQADALTARLLMVPMYRNWFNYERFCRAALARRPNHPELQGHFASMLRSVGRIREALQLDDSALRQMPRSAPLLVAHQDDLFNLGMLDEADAAAAKSFQLLPRNLEIWAARVAYLMYNGQADQAAALLADTSTRPLALDDPSRVVATQVEALVSGDPAMMRKAVGLGGAVARSGNGFVIVAAIFAAFVGDADEFFGLVNGLYFDRGFTLPKVYFTRSTGPYVGHEPATAFLFFRELARVRRDPRFAALTRDLGLDRYWARTNSRSLVVV